MSSKDNKNKIFKEIMSTVSSVEEDVTDFVFSDWKYYKTPFSSPLPHSPPEHSQIDSRNQPG